MFTCLIVFEYYYLGVIFSCYAPFALLCTLLKLLLRFVLLSRAPYTSNFYIVINACLNTLLSTFSHAVPDSAFPRLEIEGCPVTYDRQSEKYEVKFQWRAPFPPSVLSHIDFFLIRGHKFQRGDIYDALIEPSSFRHKVFVNVSFITLAQLLILLCTIHFRPSITVFIPSQHCWTHLRI